MEREHPGYLSEVAHDTHYDYAEEFDRLSHDMYKHATSPDFDPTFFERIVEPQLDDHYYHRAPEGVREHLNYHMYQ